MVKVKDYPIELLLSYEEIMKHNDLELNSLYNNASVAKNLSLKLLKEGRNSKGYCYNYALRDYNMECLEDVIFVLKYDFGQIELSKIKKGDIIVFYNSDIEKLLSEYNVEHLGIVVKPNKNLNKVIIRSKWGDMGIYETNLVTIPKIYGDRVCFFRRKES